jgi:hypothetical protein
MLHEIRPLHGRRRHRRRRHRRSAPAHRGANAAHSERIRRP